MSFIKTLIKSLNLTKQLGDIASLNTSIIIKYILSEFKVFKFAIEASFIKKSTNDAQPLLEFFKRSCFFRDYIYLWQSWSQPNLSSTTTKVGAKHLRFILTNQPTPSTSTNNSLLLLTTGLFNNDYLRSSTVTKLDSLYLSIIWAKAVACISSVLNKSFSFGFFYIQGFAFILFIDACLTDDEPLWEPIEWSLVQT